MVLLAMVLQLVLERVATSDLQRVVHDRASAVTSSIHVTPEGQITVPRSQLTPGVAVYLSGGTLVKGSVPESLEDDYTDLSVTTRVRVLRRNDSNVLIEAAPFHKSGVSGVVIVTEQQGPYDEAERLALVVSLVTGILATGAAAAVAAWVTRRALRPVEEMARTASDWSEHDLGRRFALGSPTNEITALAATLDGLLDRVQGVIHSEQRLTAELAHELRTPLTSIRGDADLILMRGKLPDSERQAVEEVAAAAKRMSTTISTLLELARNESSMVEASQSSLADVLDEVRRDTPPAEGVALDVHVDGVRLGIPQPLAVRALAPVVANALRYARSRVSVTASRDGHGYVEVGVRDDGPGISAAVAESLFEPGTTSGGTTGLGLALSRRIARSSGGDVAVSPDSRPGATTFTVRLPAV
jgi:signal transduction histidine kinase